MAGKQQAGAGRVPPFGFDDPGMAFDFSALQNVLEVRLAVLADETGLFSCL